MNAVLGIDTSCYRTSLALAGEGAIVAQRRRLLPVAEGGRGLRQSDALFRHVERLGGLAEELMRDRTDADICAVCVSSRPRPVDGSYMPVFLAGEMAARSIAAAMRVPLYLTSHQQGHVRAALIGVAMPPGDFLAVHLSGGTTEILRVGEGLAIDMLGGTTDLNAGQLVDRVGVRLGQAFPAGEALEQMAAGQTATHVIPTANRGLTVSFSGAEAQAMRMIDAGEDGAQVAIEVYSLIARSLAKLIDRAARETSLTRVLMSGGVAASGILRQMLGARLRRLGSAAELFWGEPRFSGDNAAGVALIGEAYFHTQEADS